MTSLAARIPARFSIIAAAVLFSTGGAAIKASTFTAWQVAGFRSAIAIAALLLVEPATRRRWTRKDVAAGLPYALTMVLFVAANKLTTAANAIFLQATAPLYLLVIGPRVFGERVRVRDAAFLPAYAAGLGLFLLDRSPDFASAPNPGLGNALAALSALAWAFTIGALRALERDPAAHGASGPAIVVGNLVAFVGTLPVALPVGTHDSADWALVVYLGTFQVGLAYWFLMRGVRGVPALEASLLLLLEPILNSLWAWMVHGERPGAFGFGGAAVILAATVARIALDARQPAVISRRGR